MALTEEDAKRAIDIKKELRVIVDKSGNARMKKADVVYHEEGKRFLEAEGFGHLIAQRGGDT